jgi:hypothetical protein
MIGHVLPSYDISTGFTGGAGRTPVAAHLHVPEQALAHHYQRLPVPHIAFEAGNGGNRDGLQRAKLGKGRDRISEPEK